MKAIYSNAGIAQNFHVGHCRVWIIPAPFEFQRQFYKLFRAVGYWLFALIIMSWIALLVSCAAEFIARTRLIINRLPFWQRQAFRSIILHLARRGAGGGCRWLFCYHSRLLSWFCVWPKGWLLAHTLNLDLSVAHRTNGWRLGTWSESHHNPFSCFVLLPKHTHPRGS